MHTAEHLSQEEIAKEIQPWYSSTESQELNRHVAVAERDIIKQLRFWMDENNITQTELAVAMSYCKNYVWRMLNRQYPITLSFALRLEKVTKGAFTVDEIMAASRRRL